MEEHEFNRLNDYSKLSLFANIGLDITRARDIDETLKQSALAFMLQVLRNCLVF
jgi:hypothetical protein